MSPEPSSCSNTTKALGLLIAAVTTFWIYLWFFHTKPTFWPVGTVLMVVNVIISRCFDSKLKIRGVATGVAYLLALFNMTMSFVQCQRL